MCSVATSGCHANQPANFFTGIMHVSYSALRQTIGIGAVHRSCTPCKYNFTDCKIKFAMFSIAKYYVCEVLALSAVGRAARNLCDELV